MLLNLNQIPAHVIIVDDCSNHLSKGRWTHSIICDNENLTKPLRLKGIMSYFNMRILTSNNVQISNRMGAILRFF